MWQQHTELEALGVQVAVVTFEANELARAYVGDTGLRWPLLVDERRELYHAYGMLRASFWDVWGPATWLAYLRALRRGQRLVRRHDESDADVHQRGGDVLIDPAGVVRLHHVGEGPADRPAVSEIFAQIERLASSS